MRRCFANLSWFLLILFNGKEINVFRNIACILIASLCLAASVLAAEKKAPAPAPVEKKSATKPYNSLNPADGAMINNAKPVISAEFMDEGIGVNATNIKMYIDGVDVTPAAQATANKITYTPKEPLSDGAHKVKLDIDDKAGNPSTASWSFSVHTKPPEIKIGSIKPNQYINRSPIFITGTVSDPRAKVLVNGIVAVVEKGAFSANVNIIEGKNTITAVATDMFGNTGSDSVSLVLDSRPPSIDIVSPSANSLINAKTVAVSGSVDRNAASVAITTHAGGQNAAAEIGAGTFTAKEVKLDEGLNVITAKAVSQSGNIGSATIKITVDTVPPKITLTTPKDQSVVNKKMITITGTIDDPTATVKINNTPVQVAKGTFSLSGLNLNEGSNKISATAVDRAGNVSPEAFIFVMLDTTPPAPPTLGNQPSVTRDSSIIITGTAEPGSKVDVFSNSGAKGSVTVDEKGAFSIKVGLAEGNNAITAVAYDAIGNASTPSSSINVFLDTKPPKIL